MSRKYSAKKKKGFSDKFAKGLYKTVKKSMDTDNKWAKKRRK